MNEAHAPELLIDTDDSETAAVLYPWLATNFAGAPPAGQIEGYRSPAGTDLYTALASDPELAAPAEAMRAAVLRGPTFAGAAAEITTVYNLLFLGLGGPETVPPYESAHTSEDGRLFQQATTRMEGLLRVLGMVAAGLPAEPADHIAIELETLAELIRRGDEDRRAQFLEDHLMGWVPGFCRMAIDRDRQGFYGAAARLLGVLMERERAQRHPAITAITRTEDASCLSRT
jgi:TorA-specific chaperone